ncbi:protein ROOT PRIMORDIUM DEFECTIVE 1 [Brachypodium distachyon]|nr:protein ROOT PRIMORDIUM DEFECTIVE 1 [Brachypodium distachyon]XP_014757030.1 protein ROOT PRIMORDIUM DEFECTIVE 1 [Brachypodium distachyon]XP_014757033.1 protein ROOT PRIMORDIUM DEFECTIVE 1 [Brachypodium distachyon]XP_024316509.1 protein ROOT PRIMORDIUM DEFECTIVE 1 [Brachypodium distachyon]XP_024316510.1 protein ROOT PRIMORDIUM DEFECTIVE 1 [Brachypodium distachyon]XP_024316511.1 protein ROOT PRIMORDIUM DEFECTIVE 1 [Brachypodium distachyon]|eukprot:XP_003572573.1 protein ROOT PRIMORDIUM DEFECTIVE 1 [Brachypodium distachyon]
MAWGLRRAATAGRRGWWEAPLYAAEQRATLVNVKLKLVKDRALDGAVSRERHLRAAHHVLDLVSSRPGHRISCPELLADKSVHKLFGSNAAALAFLRRYRTLFVLSRRGGGGVSLTDAALDLRRREVECLGASEADLLARLRRLLMLTLPRSLPLHTVDLLRWDLGLPRDYRASILRRHPDHFALAQPEGDERVWLRLLSWDDRLAVSELEKDAVGGDTTCLSFPVSFTRGFGLRSKCMAWLREWQGLPYTNPYADASGLDRRTDVSEKRNVAVFHELLHLTVAKRTERHNVSNMRKLLGMPQKFTKVFERHPGIFYLSRVGGTHTVVLREAYGGGSQLLEKHAHPLVAIREEYATMMRAALPPRRSRESRSSCSELDEESGVEEEVELSE